MHLAVMSAAGAEKQIGSQQSSIDLLSVTHSEVTPCPSVSEREFSRPWSLPVPPTLATSLNGGTFFDSVKAEPAASGMFPAAPFQKQDHAEEGEGGRRRLILWQRGKALLPRTGAVAFPWVISIPIIMLLVPIVPVVSIRPVVTIRPPPF